MLKWMVCILEQVTKMAEFAVILMTAYGSLETTMEAISLGAGLYQQTFFTGRLQGIVKKVLEVRELRERRMKLQPETTEDRN